MSVHVFGQQPAPLGDLAQGITDPQSSDPLALTQLRPGVALFYARDAVHGYELWKTDGTPGGTALVRDINPGPGGSELAARDETLYPAWARWWQTPVNHRPFAFQQFAVTANGVAYFFAHRPSTGAELWRSDGTEAGTYLIRDIWAGPRSCTYGHLRVDFHDRLAVPLIADGDAIFFGASDAAGAALWTSDGTAAGTRKLFSLHGPAPGGVGYEFAGPHSLARVGNKVFFVGDDGRRHGEEPFAFDLSTGTCRIIEDLDPTEDDSGVSAAQTPLLLNGKLYFFGTTIADNSLELGQLPLVFEYDGQYVDVAAGLDAEIYRGSLVANAGIGRVGNRFVVLASTSQPVGPGALFATDPELELPNSARCTTPMEIFVPVLGPVLGTGAREFLLFPAFRDDTGWELWRTDGTHAGTALVQNLNTDDAPGESRTASGLAAGLTPLLESRALNGHVYHSPRDDWSRPWPLFQHGRWWYFAATRGGADYLPPDRAYAHARNTHLNLELYRSDGAAGAVELVAELEPGSTGSFPRDFAALDTGRFVFTASTTASGRELWVSDGTAAGTRMVCDVTAVFGAGSDPGPFVEMAGRGVLFAATDPAHGREPWLAPASGTPALLGDLEPGLAGSDPCYPTAVGDRVFFGARTSTAGLEPFVTDGTLSGTRLIKDINPGPGDGFGVSGPDGRVARGAGFGAVGGRFVFPGDDGATGREPWMSDGTEAGTSLLRDIYDAEPSSPGEIQSSLGWLDPGGGRGNWASMMAGGSYRAWIAPPPFAVANGSLFFTAFDAVHGARLSVGGGFLHNEWGDPRYAGGGGELWRTDGTASGTQIVADVNRFALEGITTQYGSHPRNLTPLSNAHLPPGSLVFYAHDGNAYYPDYHGLGRELYVYNAGTGAASLVRDINPTPPAWEYGSGGSEIERPMAGVSGVAYFAADDGVSGAELWRTDGTPAGTVMVADLNPGPGASDPGPFALLGDRLVFQAVDAPSGEYRLYSYAPGETAPVLLSETVRVARSASDVATIAAWNGRVYFAGYAAQGGSGVELYSTDGTPGSVRLERDINPGPSSSAPRHLAATSRGLYFSATDGVHGLEPWVIPSRPTPCRADFDGLGRVGVTDIFAFLSAWFAAEDRADFDASGAVDVRDIFDFLSSWFAGCD